MVINTNVQAQQTANNLNVSSNALAKSLSRLSSGSKIIAPSDDAAGLAVSSRLESQLKRLDAAINNVVNAVSFTQTQDGFLKTIDKAFRRMSELAMYSQDSTKSASDLTLYSQEFGQLQEYISQTVSQTFNSVPLFSPEAIDVTIDSSGTTFSMKGIDLSTAEYAQSLAVPASVDLSTATVARLANGDITITFATPADAAKLTKDGSLSLGGLTNTMTDLNGTYDVLSSNTTTGVVTLKGDPTKTGAVAYAAADAAGVTAKTGLDITTVPRAQAALSRIISSINKLAQDRASLGAVQSRLNFTNEQLTVTKENLSAAISRIADVDVAEEATAYARYQILVQSGTSMLAQANKMPQSAMMLLQN